MELAMFADSEESTRDDEGVWGKKVGTEQKEKKWPMRPEGCSGRLSASTRGYYSPLVHNKDTHKIQPIYSL